MFDAVLVANRGEIAIRVLRACRELGIRTVAVYSDVDRDAPHVTAADEAHRIGADGPPGAAYLDVPGILEVAARADVDAIHPGYGFLSENADFAQAVTSAGRTFIGPTADAIRTMGDKLAARQVAQAVDVPVVPGTTELSSDPEAALDFGSRYGYPVAVKAMFGGGGRGMKVVRDASELREALDAARREATVAFGRGECYLERYLDRPRHIEVQVLGDLDGTVVHLGDRDCSLQRRHQKLVEEAPATGLEPTTRDALHTAAVRIAEEIGYTNAGTCEFLLDRAGEQFFFLEMNTRLQVEHPVTELVTGIDLVQAQLAIASGEGRGFAQRDVRVHGHAIEVRINAEDPARGFLPTPGTITALQPPLGPWVRFDTGATTGTTISADYDSLIAKLAVWAPTRDGARARMTRALHELVLTGVPTTEGFHRLAMAHPAFVAATHSTVAVEQDWDLSGLQSQDAPVASGEGAETSRELTVEVGGRRFEVRVHRGDGSARGPTRRRTSVRQGAVPAPADSDELVAPMRGTVVTYLVDEGAEVAAGEPVVVLEAMKMENAVRAHRAGVLTHGPFVPGDTVESGAVLARITDA